MSGTLSHSCEQIYTLEMKRRIIERIRANGPMYFDEYMEMCLYDPVDGYFTSGEIRPGTGGDFLTSPEVSLWFPNLVGAWAAGNKPSEEAALVEVGSGSGAMLEYLAPFWLDDELPVYAVERSLAARSALAGRPGIEVVASIDEVPSGIDVVLVANEVLDNMPAALGRRAQDGWIELAVTDEDGDLGLVQIDARPAVAQWCADLFPDAAHGTTVTVQLAVAEWIEQVFSRFRMASICLIDYAGTSNELGSRELDSIIRTYRHHQTGVDWLNHPGASDLTVDVNIDGVLRAIRGSGAHVRRLPQSTFLLEQGGMEIVDDARVMERLHAKEGRIMDQLVAKSERINIEALLDPDGLGGFTVFLVE
jgi:NADH dehydrogenase [ubiquinone] 1 alpha subcomplex assembly factor 7